MIYFVHLNPLIGFVIWYSFVDNSLYSNTCSFFVIVATGWIIMRLDGRGFRLKPNDILANTFSKLIYGDIVWRSLQ